MQKRLLIMAVVVLGLSTMMLTSTGCSREKAHGKLQIMFSGNIRGNASPCG
jgi:hypothetical protein